MSNLRNNYLAVEGIKKENTFEQQRRKLEKQKKFKKDGRAIMRGDRSYARILN